MQRGTILFSAILFIFSLGTVSAAPPPKQSPGVVRSGQDRPSTLIDDDDRLGWYVAPSVGYTSIRTNDGLLLGAKGGMVLNHQLVLGAAGYVFSRNAFGNSNGPAADFAYGGAYVEYVFLPKELVHFSLSSVLGAGSANSEFILVANPAINAIMNVSSSVHLGLEVAYRGTKIMPTDRPDPGWFSGPSFSLFLQFGHF